MNPFSFTAEVHRRGYTIIDAIVDRNPARLLTDLIKPRQRYRVFEVQPLRLSTLHLRFSRIKTEDDVVAFADEFGMLGITTHADRNQPMVMGELVSQWLAQSAYLAGTLDFAYSSRRVAMESGVNDLLSDVRAQLVFEARGPAVKLVPRNLLSAIWLQFALSLDMKRKYRRCLNCRAWIEISLAEGGRSARALYCSDGCKQKSRIRRALRAPTS